MENKLCLFAAISNLLQPFYSSTLSKLISLTQDELHEMENKLPIARMSNLQQSIYISTQPYFRRCNLDKTTATQPNLRNLATSCMQTIPTYCNLAKAHATSFFNTSNKRHSKTTIMGIRVSLLASSV